MGARVESTVEEQSELTTVPLTKSTTKPHRFALLRFSLYAYGGNDYAPWGRPEQMLVQCPSKELYDLYDEVCTMPVFRPVIGFDKQEIVDVSEKIGTYETSIQPYEDCCTIFVAKHPVTKPNLKVIRNSERHLEEKLDELVTTALATVEVIACRREV